MAGVKGKSGGPRPNSGGARPGAGRKPKAQPETVAVECGDPLEFLKRVYSGLVIPTDAQLKAAIAACAYIHRKPGESGKKEERMNKAKEFTQRLGVRPYLQAVK